MKYISFILLLSMFGCVEQPEKQSVIAVSIEPLKFFVDEISNNEFDVSVVVPKGASAETFEPTPSIIRSISKSKVFISTGILDVETNVISYIDKQDSIINLELKEYCTLLESEFLCSGNHSQEPNQESSGHIHQGVDPHIWISVANSKKIATSIKDFLVKLNRDSSDKYNMNYEKLMVDLNKVDSIFKSKKINTVLVYHPFLGYLADEYNFEQVSIEDEGKEPSAKKMKELILRARKEGIDKVFYQSQFPTNSVKSISDELNAEIYVVDPLEYNHVSNLINIAQSISHE